MWHGVPSMKSMLNVPLVRLPFADGGFPMHFTTMISAYLQLDFTYPDYFLKDAQRKRDTL